MIESRVLKYDRDCTEFQDLLRFRYNCYINELKYLPTTKEFEESKIEFDQYDPHSEHIIVKKDTRIIGCARIIKNSYEYGLPILNKNPFKKNSEFNHINNVEVSRLIVDKDCRSSIVFVILLQTVFRSLVSLGCRYVLADTFVDSSSYKLLLGLGFKQVDMEYRDSSFNLEVNSKLLYTNMDEILFVLANQPNQEQKAFMRHLKYII
jgi:N-acyl-L-homoserine lactone synthetase